MTEHNKALPTAQEDELQRKLAAVTAYDLPKFQRNAFKFAYFAEWFRERYKGELTRPDQITEDMRPPYMAAWEAELRRIMWDRIEAEELPPLPDPDDDPPRRGPIGDRHGEDREGDDAAGDDGEEHEAGDGEEAKAGGSTPRYDLSAPPIKDSGPDDGREDDATGPWLAHPTIPGALQRLGGREIMEGGIVYRSRADYDHHHPTEEESRRIDEILLDQLEAQQRLDDGADEFQDDPRLAGVGLEHIEEDGAELYVVPFVIPTEGASMVFGEQKHGKSIWAQKLTVCITSDGLEFDGLKVRHGRVLYITADSGARRRQVKTRFRQICERLSVQQPTIDRLVIVDTAVKLNDPKSVDDLIRKNPGAFVLVVIDPLFRCVNGRLSGEEVAADIDEGLTRIAEATGAAVLVVHHEPAATEKPFGSVFLQAGGVAQVHVVRHTKGGVYRDGDKVTVTVQWLKNDEPPEKPFEYRIEGAYLTGPQDSKGAPVVAPVEKIPHPKALARLPLAARPLRGARAIVEDLLNGTEHAREKQWERWRKAWQAAGVIEQKDGEIRRLIGAPDTVSSPL